MKTASTIRAELAQIKTGSIESLDERCKAGDNIINEALLDYFKAGTSHPQRLPKENGVAMNVEISKEEYDLLKQKDDALDWLRESTLTIQRFNDDKGFNHEAGNDLLAEINQARNG